MVNSYLRFIENHANKFQIVADSSILIKMLDNFKHNNQNEKFIHLLTKIFEFDPTDIPQELGKYIFKNFHYDVEEYIIWDQEIFENYANKFISTIDSPTEPQEIVLTQALTNLSQTDNTNKILNFDEMFKNIQKVSKDLNQEARYSHNRDKLIPKVLSPYKASEIIDLLNYLKTEQPDNLDYLLGTILDTLTIKGSKYLPLQQYIFQELSSETKKLISDDYYEIIKQLATTLPVPQESKLPDALSESDHDIILIPDIIVNEPSPLLLAGEN